MASNPVRRNVVYITAHPTPGFHGMGFAWEGPGFRPHQTGAIYVPLSLKDYRTATGRPAPGAVPLALAHEIGHWRLGHRVVKHKDATGLLAQELAAWRFAIQSKGTPLTQQERRAVAENFGSYLLDVPRSQQGLWREHIQRLLTRTRSDQELEDERNPYPWSWMRQPEVSRPYIRRSLQASVSDIQKGYIPLPTALAPEDRRRLSRLMRQVGIQAVTVDVQPTSKRDIAVYLGRLPRIIVGQKWMKAAPHERAKRMLHELCHVKGARHDGQARKMGYFSNPDRDVFTRKLYQSLTGVRL